MPATLGNHKEALPPLPSWNGINQLCTPRAALVALLTALFSMYMIGLTATRSTHGRQTFHFEYVTVTLIQECLKFAIAFSMWTSSNKAWSRRKQPAGAGDCNRMDLEVRAGKNVFKFQTFLKYGIPGLLYSFDNNFQYVILGFLQPTELAVLWNFKIFATVVFLHVFLERKYTRNQWAAMLVLVLGCALTQVPCPWTAERVPLMPVAGTTDHSGAHTPKRVSLLFDFGGGAELPPHLYAATLEGPEASSRWSRTLVGALLALAGSTTAAASNVYCEWLVKQHPQDSIDFQMMQLYSFGVFLNAVTLVVKAAIDPDSPIHQQGGFFAGYDSWVWTIILLGTASGLAISAALKHMDNIAVIFAHALAVLVVAAISAEYFNLHLSLPFLIGGMLVLASLLAFHSDEHGPSGRGARDGATEASPLCGGCSTPAAADCSTRSSCKGVAGLTRKALREDSEARCLT